ADYRISNLYGEDRPPTEEDVRMLLQYLVGYRIEDLTYREIDVGMPTIEVVSEIPSGGFTAFGIDVEYVATPSEGAYIREVLYQYEGGGTRVLYLSGTIPMHHGQRGTLGQAWLPLRDEDREEKLIISVEDSAGLTATYEIENMPYFIDLSYEVPDLPEREWASSDTMRIDYVTNRLEVYIIRPSSEDPGDIDIDAMVEAFTSIEGEVESYNGSSYFIICVPPTDEYGLDTKGEYLLKNYPHLFEEYGIQYIPMVSLWNSTAPKGGGSFNSGVTTGSSFRTNNNNWWYTGRDWPLHAVGFTWAWSVFGAQVRQDTKVGILDDGVNREHSSLQMLPSNVSMGHGNSSHGTPVMGIIAAAHNTGGQAVGAINIAREDIYSYDVFLTLGGTTLAPPDSILAGLDRLVKGHDVKVINISIGEVEARDPFTSTLFGNQKPTAPSFNRKMNELATGRNGKDFLVIHAAGNDTREAKYNGMFALVTEPDLRRRIITVGNSMGDGNVAIDSNFGSYVDVLAPGEDVYTTTSNGGIGIFSGTSFSAPHVAALAALIWAEAPRLSPERVKEIIVQSAYSHGRRIVDNRTNIPEEHRGRTYYEINAPAALFMARGIDPNSYLGNARDLSVKPYRAVVVGHVIDPEGNPVKDAHVRLYDQTNLLHEAHTNDYGFYRMFDVVPYEVNPRANLRMGIFTHTHAPYILENMTVNAGINEYTHELRHSMRVNVTLMNATTSTPIANRTITLSHRNDHNTTWTSKTDGRGQAELHVSMVHPAVRSITYNIRIEAQGATDTRVGTITLTAPWPTTMTPTATPNRKSVTIYDITDEFPPNARTAMLSQLSKQPDGRIYTHEVAELTEVHFCSLEIQDMQELSALKYFTAMTHLCIEGNQLTELDLSSYQNLKIVRARYNPLVSVNITQNIKLEELNLYYCNLTSIDVSNNVNLWYLNVINNFMQSRNDVIGWQNTKVIRSGNNVYGFYFEYQRVQGQSESEAPTLDFTPHDFTPHDHPIPTP
ncbi:MAG: S8 family serine peptidase, partial [Defluviitaleaceae bacterium]|nr:S8 family serine peptidase [Defluviitaleaceae bacterium]